MDEYLKEMAVRTRHMAEWLEQITVDDEEANVIGIITAMNDLASEAGIIALRLNVNVPPGYEGMS